MAWNEPGGNKDPWSRKPKGNSEVDKLINEFSKSSFRIFGNLVDKNSKYNSFK